MWRATPALGSRARACLADGAPTARGTAVTETAARRSRAAGTIQIRPGSAFTAIGSRLPPLGGSGSRTHIPGREKSGKFAG